MIPSFKKILWFPSKGSHCFSSSNQKQIMSNLRKRKPMQIKKYVVPVMLVCNVLCGCDTVILQILAF